MRLRSIVLSLAGVASLVAPLSAAETNSPGQRSANPLASLAKPNVRAFIERPLFDPTRQLPPVPLASPPPPPAPPPPPPPPAPAPELHLVGVIYGRSPVAFVREDEASPIRTVHTGDNIHGWRVTIRPNNQLRISNGDRKVDYKLFSRAASDHSDNVDLSPAAETRPGVYRAASEEQPPSAR